MPALREMLIDVGERPSAYIGAVAAMSEPRSSLKERITLMVGDSAKWGSVAMVAFGSLALALVAVAIQVTPPNFGSTFGTRRPVTLEPAVLDRYVGYYLGGSHAVFIVTRDGARLFLKIPLDDPGNSLQTVRELSWRPVCPRSRSSKTHRGRPQGSSRTWRRRSRNLGCALMLQLRRQSWPNLTLSIGIRPTPGSEAALRQCLMECLQAHPITTSPWLAEQVKPE